MVLYKFMMRECEYHKISKIKSKWVKSSEVNKTRCLWNMRQTDKKKIGVINNVKLMILILQVSLQCNLVAGFVVPYHGFLKTSFKDSLTEVFLPKHQETLIVPTH